MSSRIEFDLAASRQRFHDAAIILGDDDPVAEVANTAIGAISTDVMITAGGVTMHLAGWLDPGHWESDWQEAGVEDVAAYAAALITESTDQPEGLELE